MINIDINAAAVEQIHFFYQTENVLRSQDRRVSAHTVLSLLGFFMMANPVALYIGRTKEKLYKILKTIFIKNVENQSFK